MTCEQAQQMLLELESPAQGPAELLEHVAGCSRCQAVAERVRQADELVAERVERFASKGDFEKEWTQARERVAEGRRRPTWRYFVATAALAAALLLVLRVALLPAPRLPVIPELGPEPVIVPVVPAESPVASPPARAPDPAPDPAPPPSPAPSPPRTVRAKPATRPQPTSPAPARPEPPAPAPAPEPVPEPSEPDPVETPNVSPVATEPPPPRVLRPEGRTVTVQLDPALSTQRGTLLCPSGRIRASRSGDALRFSDVPEESCSLEIGGSTLPGVDASSNRYLVDSSLVLRPL